MTGSPAPETQHSRRRLWRLIVFSVVTAVGIAMIIGALRPPRLIPPLELIRQAEALDISTETLVARNARSSWWISTISILNGALAIALVSAWLKSSSLPMPLAVPESNSIERSVGSELLRQRHRDWIALGLLCLVAAITRAPALWHSLWYDELFTLLNYANNGWRHALFAYDAPNNHILYTVTLQAWSFVLPTNLSTSALTVLQRLPSLICGVAVIPLVWLIGRRVFDRGVAWHAVVIATLMPMLADCSTQLRGYAMAAMLATASTWLMIQLSTARHRHFRFWAYILVTAAMLHTHPLTIAILVAHIFWIFAHGKKSLSTRRTSVVAVLLAVMATAQLYCVVVSDALTYVEQEAATATPRLSRVNYLLECADAICWRNGISFAGVTLAGLVILGMSVGIVGSSEKSDHPRNSLLLFALPPILLIVVGLLVPNLRESRFLPLVAPPLTLLIAVGISWPAKLLTRRLPQYEKSMRYGSLTLIALLFGAGLPRVDRLPVQELRGAMQRAAQISNDRSIAVLGLGCAESRYYLPAANKAWSLPDLNTIEDLGVIVVPYPRCWLNRPAHQDLRDFLQSHFDLVEQLPGRLPEDPTVEIHRRR